MGASTVELQPMGYSSLPSRVLQRARQAACGVLQPPEGILKPLEDHYYQFSNANEKQYVKVHWRLQNAFGGCHVRLQSLLGSWGRQFLGRECAAL